jgi:hypothetical protein
MQVTLSPHAEQLLRDQLARGGRSPEEVVERALEVLHSEDDWLVENRDSIDSKIRRAFACVPNCPEAVPFLFKSFALRHSGCYAGGCPVC